MENPSPSKAKEPAEGRVDRRPVEDGESTEGSLICPNCSLPTLLKLVSSGAQNRETVFKRLVITYSEANSAQPSA